MTVESYARKHGINLETVRHYIHLGKLKARRVGHQYEIDPYDTNDNNNDNIHDNIQQILSEKDPQIKQLSQQNERLTQLLAIQTRQNSQLLAQLPPPRPSLTERIGKLLTKLRTHEA